MKKQAGEKFAGISSEAVRAKTGKGWKEWFAILDRAGARKLSHGEIAKYLYTAKKCPSWWGQMITVGYEQARGMREKHQTATGYTVNSSKTIAAPVRELFEAWSDTATRKRWLADSAFTIRKATAPKSLRITWVDGKTNVDVNLLAKGSKKSQVSVEHSKLASAKEVESKRAYWAKQLERLAGMLQG